MQQIHRFLITHRASILKGFLVLEGFLVGLWFAGVGLFLADSPLFTAIASQAARMGRWSFYVFCIAITPGILKRLGFLKQLQITLMLFRRHFGITMFLFAMNHMGFMFFISSVFSGRFKFANLNSMMLWGLASILLLLPLWITSNDWSVKKLGVWWHRIHALIYIAVFTIYMHVGFTNQTLAWIALTFLILEIVSYLKYWYEKYVKKTPPIPPSPPATAVQTSDQPQQVSPPVTVLPS